LAEHRQAAPWGGDVSEERKPDPLADAERQLRLAMASEAKRDRDTREKIQKGFYGCITIVVVLFLVALFLL
jgi:hypothetical protein